MGLYGKGIVKIAGIALLFLNSGWCQQVSVDNLLADGHYGGALPLVRIALQRNPQDVDALIALSTIEWAYGELGMATVNAEKAVATAEGSAKAHAQLINVLGATLASGKASTLEKLSLARRFRREVDRTLQLDPGNLHAHEALARYYWYAPSLSGGDRAKAQQIVGQLIGLDAARGYALKAELDGTDPDRVKRLTTVLDDWKQAVTTAPRSYTAHAGLSECFLHAGNVKAAADEAKMALAINPSRITAYRLLTEIYVTSGEWENLDGLLQRARMAMPNDLSPEFTAAQTILDREMQSQYVRAEGYLRNYLDQPAEGLGPTLPVAHWRLGQVLEREGRRATALTEVQTAVNLDPSLDGARRDMKRLQ